MPALRQTRFVMPIADDVRLVGVDTARASIGVTAEEIFERVEDHAAEDHLPAFDIAVKGSSRREIRVWAGALRSASWRQRGTPATLLDSIISDCLLTNLQGLPNQQINLHNSQLERAWCVSNETLLRMIGLELIRGVRVGRNWKVNRASAAAFLKSRAL